MRLDLGDVRVGLAVVPAADELIAGLIVEFGEIAMAREFAGCVLRYFESTQTRGFVIRIDDAEGRDRLRIDLSFDGGELAIEVQDVDPCIREEISGSLARHPSYFLLLAYRDGEKMEFLPAGENGIYKSDIEIDGSVLIGKRDGAWPVLNPVRKALER